MHHQERITKVCFITPGHISTNPRLVKEAITLSERNFNVHIIFTQYIEKLIEEDYKILKNHPTITYDVLNWTGNNTRSKIRRVFTGFTHRFCKKLMVHLSFIYLKKVAINRNYFWQQKKAIGIRPDLYIAHNLGALPIAVVSAKKNKVKVGFDAEDLHRYETSEEELDTQVRLKSFFEEKYMQQLDYTTAASPLIAKFYQELLNKKVTSILNVFPRLNYTYSPKSDKTLRLFWFSQTIGPNRGLETILESICILKDLDIELHLLGEIDDSFRKRLTSILINKDAATNKLKFHETISPDEIFNMAKNFDVGIAAEPSFCTNNDIALSNKIFTYLQVGLAVIASNTTAQENLLNANNGLGYLYQKDNANDFVKILIGLMEDEQKLIQAKKQSLKFAKNKFNWNLEQEKFLEIINNL